MSRKEYSDAAIAKILNENARLIKDVERLKHLVSSKENHIENLKEDIECVHLWLDKQNVPRMNKDNQLYSIIGRIQQLIYKS